MGITFGDHLIDSGHYDITPDQEREMDRDDERRRNAKRYWAKKQAAREECARRGIDPDEICADGGVEAWMVVAKELAAPPAIIVDIGRASESIAGMVADWYGNAPLPNARITADVIAQRLTRFIVPAAATTDGFHPNEFSHTAALLQSGDEQLVRATLSNNINIILAALFIASNQFSEFDEAATSLGAETLRSK